jgi:hypothetical protein
LGQNLVFSDARPQAAPALQRAHAELAAAQDRAPWQRAAQCTWNRAVLPGVGDSLPRLARLGLDLDGPSSSGATSAPSWPMYRYSIFVTPGVGMGRG